MSLFKYLLLIVLVFSFTPSEAQFWKKKGRHTNTASNGISKKRKKDKTKDAFRRKSSKGPNQKTTRRPFWKSKKNLHKHATSRKAKQGGSKNFHKKKMLHRSALKTNTGTSKGERKGRKSSKGKGGGSRGRKE